MPENDEVTPEVTTDTTGSAPTEDADRGASLKALDVGTLVDMVLNLRDENATRRTRSSAAQKEQAEAAQKWQEHLDSQKTELERINERAAKLEQELVKHRLKETREVVAKKVPGFPMALSGLLDGSEEDMMAKAKVLAAYEAERAQAQQGTPSDYAGDRGVPVTKAKSDVKGFLDDLDPQRRR